MAKGATLATAFIALVALGRARLPSRYEQAHLCFVCFDTEPSRRTDRP